MTSGNYKETHHNRPKTKAKRRLLILVSAVVLILVGLILWLCLRHEQLYKVTVLPPLGATCTRPVAINDRCQVAGIADVAGRSHLFLWDREKGMQDLGLALRFGLDINNAGQIAGTAVDPNGNRRAFCWDPNDGKKMVGTLGDGESVCVAMNNPGQIVGFSGPFKGRPQAFIWDKTNGMRSLTPDEHYYGRATAINDAGWVLGMVATEIGKSSPHLSWRLCYWKTTDPSATPEFSSEGPLGGAGLNNNGYVLGREFHWDKKGMWTYLWTQETGTKYLFPLEDSVGPLRFNDANQVLYGEKHASSLERISKKYFGPYTQHCLWDPKRGKIVLGKQIPRKLGKLVHVADINNQGCIVGMIRSKNSGKELGVLLEPIPVRWGK